MKKLFCFTLITLLVISSFFTIQSNADIKEIPQWGRFEAAFTSNRDYDNPVQDVRVEVEFVSPQKNKRTFQAFWDGGPVWKVRFSPDETGIWTYSTSCSDKSNKGLDGNQGSFRCVKYQGDNPLYQNGELRLSKNRRYIEHQNGKPFFWLADTVWCGPALADYDDWKVFLQDRVEKEFTAIQFVMTQWRMFLEDADGNPTFTGKEKIEINTDYFQRMDRYIDAINDAGLVAVPVLLWAITGEENPGSSLPADQRIALAEYMVARYGANQVIWFLGGDGSYNGEKAEPWRKIGRAVFNKDQHRLATMHVGGRQWVGDEFRNEPWFDFISYQSGHGDDEGTFRWLNQGPPSTEWKKEPVLPIINTEPNYEAHNGYKYRKVHNDHSVRRAAYWSLLVSPTAGVTYGGQGIWGWHTQVQLPANHNGTGLGSPWYEAKDLPGAFSMKYLHRFFQSIGWYRLIPAQDVIIDQPGTKDASKFIAAAKTDNGDLMVVYLPEGGEVTLNTESIQKPAQARWYHPRTGGWMKTDSIQSPKQIFKTVDRNDWVLLIQAE